MPDIIGNSIFLMDNGEIPSAYQKVEYIYSTQTSRGNGPTIDTGFSPSPDMKIECGYYATGETGGAWGTLFGGSYGDAAKILKVLRKDQTNALLGQVVNEYTDQPAEAPDGFSAGNHVAILDALNAILTLDGISTELSMEPLEETPYHICLLAHNVNASGKGYWFINPAGPTIRIKYLKIFKNNHIVQYLVACKRRSDNSVGMYDRVTNTFFRNPGSGSLTAGANIN